MAVDTLQHFHGLFNAIAYDDHFGVTAHPWQTNVGRKIMWIHANKVPVQFLCVQGTGAGKSVLYQSLAAHFKCVILYISPLLTLGADQEVNKLMEQTQNSSSLSFSFCSSSSVP